MAPLVARGDVVSFVAGEELVYLQYLGRHPEYGDTVAVCPVLQPKRVKVNEDLFRSAYIAFYPLRTAVARGLATVLGSMPCVMEVPQRLRRAGMRSKRRVDTWVIENPPDEEVVKQRLSAEELKIPIASIWNHEFLLQRVSSGWRPERESED